VRPEKLRLAEPDPSGSPRSLKRGTVEEVVFAGSMRKLWVRLEQEQTLVLAYRYENEAAGVKGASVGLVWDSEDEVTLQP